MAAVLFLIPLERFLGPQCANVSGCLILVLAMLLYHYKPQNHRRWTLAEVLRGSWKSPCREGLKQDSSIQTTPR